MRRLLLPLCAIALAAAPAAAAIYTVAPDGSGDFPTIQAAIDAADHDDTIELTDGTFTGDGNRDLDFRGKRIQVTSQSRDAASCILDAGGSAAEPHRVADFQGGEDPATILDYVTITGGWATEGGGIRCRNGSSPIIGYATITGNVGGGIFCIDFSHPDVIVCEIVDNTGIGIYAIDDAGADVEECRILGNSSRGVSVNYEGVVYINDSFVRGNGGGVFVTDGSIVEVWTSVITGNATTGNGGGFGCGNATLRVHTSTISGNRAERGGGIYVDSEAVVTVDQSIVWGNCATSGSEIYAVDVEQPVAVSCCAMNHSGVAGKVACGSCVDGDPLFCGPVPCEAAPTIAGDYTLGATSPCLPDAHPCGPILIGALGQGCAGPVPTVGSTWSGIKEAFRR